MFVHSELSKCESGLFLKPSKNGGIIWGESKHINLGGDLVEQKTHSRLKSTGKRKHKKLEITRRHSLMSYRPQDAVKDNPNYNKNLGGPTKKHLKGGSGKFDLGEMLEGSDSDSDYGEGKFFFYQLVLSPPAAPGISPNMCSFSKNHKLTRLRIVLFVCLRLVHSYVSVLFIRMCPSRL